MHFLKSGKTYKPVGSNFEVKDSLPRGFYILTYDKVNGFQLEEKPIPSVSNKTYGDQSKKSDKIINTFSDGNGDNVGVLLSGPKGTGKSRLMLQIAKDFIDKTGIVIEVQSNFKDITLEENGTSFEKVISDIPQPACILIDEFEKVFKESSESEEYPQENVLTLFQGSTCRNKLFILAVNEIVGVNPHFLNRPGRLRYHIRFKGLDAGFIRSYCEDNLNDKSEIDALVKYGKVIYNFSYDALKAIVDEMNRYGLKLSDAVKDMNIAFDPYSDEIKTIILENGADISERFNCIELQGNIFSFGGATLRLGVKNDYIPFYKERGLSSYQVFTLRPSDIVFKQGQNLEIKVNNVWNLRLLSRPELNGFWPDQPHWDGLEGDSL